MFTLEQIKTAHAKVQSGADFPDYVQDLIQLGVILYETYVSDGHTEYYGEANYQINSGSVYAPLNIASKSDRAAFLDDLKAHQRGLTNYMAFCNDCARSGIAKWTMDMQKRTCTYYDAAGNEILVENIPN